MAADQTHEFLRIHFVTVITGILMRHRLAMNGLAVNVALLCEDGFADALSRLEAVMDCSLSIRADRLT